MKWSSLVKHGCSRKSGATPEYVIWLGMRKRCLNSNTKIYPYYGGRGISICDRWGEFGNFLSDMGTRPSPLHSIDRIDRNGNYEPENCRWATRIEQMRNKGDNRLLTYRGETRCVTEWAEVLGISVHTLRRRVRNQAWTIDQILSTERINRRRA